MTADHPQKYPEVLFKLPNYQGVTVSIFHTLLF